MVLSRFQFYLLGLFLLFIPMAAWKWIWLSGTKETTGVVYYISNHRSRTARSTRPVIRYVVDNRIFSMYGPSNSGYLPGDKLSVLYRKSNPASRRLNTFWSCWWDVFALNGFLFVFWTFLFARQVIVGKRFVINRQGIKKITPGDIVPYAEIVEAPTTAKPLISKRNEDAG